MEFFDKVGGEDGGVAGDVVDGFFGVEGGALAADGFEGVYDMDAHFEHPGFENGEKAHGACAYDNNICLKILHNCFFYRCDEVCCVIVG